MGININTYSDNNKIDFLSDVVMFMALISNSFLNRRRSLKATDLYDLECKIENQFFDWYLKENRLKDKAIKINTKEDMLQYADEQNEEYNQAFKDIDNLLLHTLNVNDAINWCTLKSKEKFPKKKPLSSTPEKLAKWDKNHKLFLSTLPEEPIKDIFKPDITIIDKIIPSRKKKKENICVNEYKEALKKWQEEYDAILNQNEQKASEFNSLREDAIRSYKMDDEKVFIKWESEKKLFDKEIDLQHQRIDELKKRYKEKDVNAIEDYCEIVLNNSQYPDFISKDFALEYNASNKILVIEYQLPNISVFPTIKECKFVATKKEIKTTNISTTELNRIYDKALYDITLRTIHEAFEADTINAINAVSFNGWVQQIDKSTGNERNNCIISIQVQKEEFLKINLQNVESKICFKGLKGVSSSKLHQTTPIQPILQIKKEDKRFVEAHDVSNQIDNSTNLASIDWEDFEHLIREVFEKEFSTNGGEVKVTQASRDGGVDAIAFDPDPIRGGKIVIQAKRYTNTVNVSAVRDLYGTLMNEGATKGILVTTADYGPDAYSFAKDKPITLLNGSNLLFLLEKHGVHARIDIKEAKLLNCQQSMVAHNKI